MKDKAIVSTTYCNAAFIETCSPTFERRHKGLLIVKGFIERGPAKILIDPGGEINFISDSFCDFHQLQIMECKESAEMANGTEQVLEETSKPVTVQMKNYTEPLYFAVSPLKRYDAIIGKEWCGAHRALIDCWRNEVRFIHKRKKYVVEADENIHSPFVSVNSLMRNFEEKHALFAVVVRPIEEEASVPKYSPEIQNLLDQFTDVFPVEIPKGFPPKRKHDFKIELQEDAKPQKKGIYKLSEPEMKELRRQLDELLEKEFIRPSKSPWGAPIIFMTKKDNTLRMCVDYRALNKLTVKNSYPLPRIDEMFDQLKGAKYFTKIDLRSGYHQIRLSEESIPMTAFRTRYGHFEYLVLPFGLTNAPATFMTVMNEIFKDYLDVFVIIYIDDILVYSKTWKDHLQHVKKILEILRKEKFFGKLTKCIFGATEVEYLGHLISNDGIKVDPDKVTAVTEWPIPRTKQQVQSFLGLVNYYRRFIKDCSLLAKPLTNLTKKVPFEWKQEQTECFEKLKKALTTAPVLRSFDSALPVVVTTDASQFAIGAVLEQEEDSKKRPVAFASRTLNAAEQNYAAHERELLAVVDSLRWWRSYLHGKSFTVHSDHYPLRYLETQDSLSPRQVRWLERLSNFDFKIIPISGKSNVVADALSRQPIDAPSPDHRNKSLLREVINDTSMESNHISFVKFEHADFVGIEQDYERDNHFSKSYKNPQPPYERHRKLLVRNERSAYLKENSESSFCMTTTARQIRDI